MHPSPPAKPDAGDTLPSGEADPFVHRLRAFLTDRGISRHRHASHLAEILNLSRHVIYRRFEGNPTFNDLERSTIATYYQMSVEDLANWGAPLTGSVALPAARRMRPRGFMRTKLVPEGVSLEFAMTEEEARRSPLLAVECGAHWEVFRREDVPAYAQHTRAVVRIIIDVLAPPVIAVLEDDVPTAELLRQACEDAGLQVEVYTTVEDLAAAVRSRSFHGFICDWFLDGKDARGVISQIRAQQAEVPIVIASGKIDVAGEASLQEFADEVGAEIQEKPYRLSLLASRMRRLIADAKAVPPSPAA